MAGFEPAGTVRPLVVSTDAVSATHPHLQNFSWEGGIRTPEIWHINSVLAYHLPTTQYIVGRERFELPNAKASWVTASLL